MALNYKAPISGQKSTIDGSNSDQMNTFYWLKKAIIQSRKEQYFMPLASVQNMPKHFGKTIKVYEYVPLLDARNINDQGIDANGVTMVSTQWDAIDANGAILAGGPYASEAAALAVAGATNAVQRSGFLYGSSRDVGSITGRLPVLTENGGRVNRVGFTRLDREGSIQKFGFFFDFTQESLDFDSEDDLKEKLSTELMNGAVQLTEAVLQKDLLAAAGVIVWGGDAISHATVTAEGAGAALLTYDLIMRLDQALTENRTPRQTKVITGSRNIDTKVIPSCRVAFIGPELYPVLRAMKDLHNEPAFIPVQRYADAGTVLNGEIGSIDAIRFVQVPEMLHWAGVGEAVVANPGYRETNGKYDVFPVMVVGDDSFTTIGFQTDGKSVKFNVRTKMPGENITYDDPYGETGFTSIKWYYGILVKRPERIGMIKVVAPQ